LGIQFAKAKGLKVIGTDAREDGLALSREVGADLVLDARMGKEEVVRRVFTATGGKGVDATITTSDAKAAVATACGMTRRHGTMVYVPVVSISDPFVKFRSAYWLFSFRDMKFVFPSRN
jgi:propanol-preferring alcohol dehydrogenase